MALDMANSDACSATVKVLVSFYLVAANESSSSVKNLGNPQVLFSGALKNLHWVSRTRKSKGLGEKPEVMIVILSMLFHHTEVQKAISFSKEPLKTCVNSK